MAAQLAAQHGACRLPSRRPAPAQSTVAALFNGLKSHAAGAGALGRHGAPPPCFMATARRAVARAGAGCGASCRQVTTMMPIGVPKVPYRTPGESGWQWVDIWNCLYRERIIFIGNNIDEEMGNQLVGTMLFLDTVSNKDLYLYVNTKGGDIVPAFAIHDTMKAMKSDVGTVAFGGALAMGAFLLGVGTKGKRNALPNTQIMLQAPFGAARGQASDIINETRELVRVRGYMTGILAEATGRGVARMTADLKRDQYFTPQQAVEYGLIDKVVYPKRSKQMGL